MRNFHSYLSLGLKKKHSQFFKFTTFYLWSWTLLRLMLMRCDSVTNSSNKYVCLPACSYEWPPKVCAPCSFLCTPPRLSHNSLKKERWKQIDFEVLLLQRYTTPWCVLIKSMSVFLPVGMNDRRSCAPPVPSCAIPQGFHTTSWSRRGESR